MVSARVRGITCAVALLTGALVLAGGPSQAAVAGNYDDEGGHPYVVAVLAISRDDPDGAGPRPVDDFAQMICVGTLVSERLVITGSGCARRIASLPTGTRIAATSDQALPPAGDAGAMPVRAFDGLTYADPGDPRVVGPGVAALALAPWPSGDGYGAGFGAFPQIPPPGLLESVTRTPAKPARFTVVDFVSGLEPVLGTAEDSFDTVVGRRVDYLSLASIDATTFSSTRLRGLGQGDTCAGQDGSPVLFSMGDATYLVGVMVEGDAPCARALAAFRLDRTDVIHALTSHP